MNSLGDAEDLFSSSLFDSDRKLNLTEDHIYSIYKIKYKMI